MVTVKPVPAVAVAGALMAKEATAGLTAMGALVPVTTDAAVRVTVFGVSRVTMTVAVPLNRLIEAGGEVDQSAYRCWSG